MALRHTDSALAPVLLVGADETREVAAAIEADVLQLFDRFRSPLLRYIGSFGLSARDAEDIVQEVFLSLFRHLHVGKPRHNLQGWLFRVAHNHALKERQRLRRHGAANRLDASPLAGAPDPAGDPEARLADSQRRRRLVAVVNALPERDRLCLHLRNEGLRYRDIARVLGLSLGTVAKSLARSLARLQRADEG